MDTFELEIEYKGSTVHYPCAAQQFRYSYRFTVTIDQTSIFFEPDEENQLRARIEDQPALPTSTKDQVILIAKELQRLLDDDK